MTYTATCLCSGIAFRIDGPLGPLQMCHCGQCRKAQGSAFAANVPVARADVRFERGESLVTEYESSPGKKRAFCSRCGSPLYSRRDEIPEVLRVRAGLINEDLPSPPEAQYCTAWKANWWTLDERVPQVEGVYVPAARER